jgi:hypothetical protein
MQRSWKRWGRESERSTPEYIAHIIEESRHWREDQHDVGELLFDLERYFVDRGLGDRIIGPGDEGVAVENIRIALAHLINRQLRRGGAVFNQELSDAIREFQIRNGHSSRDGLFGPGTRALLTRTLFERECRSFSLLRDPEMRHKGHAFISYGSADRASANDVAGIVRQLGFSVWWDQEIAGGERWNDEISRQLSAAFLIILINSMNAASSKWVKREISVADNLDKTILPINVETGLNHNDLTVFFYNVQPIERRADDFVSRLRVSLMKAHQLWRSNNK